MTKKPRRGRDRRGKLFAPVVDDVLALSTLATKDLIAAVIGDNPGIEMYAIMARLSWSVIGLTEGDGPIWVGLAHEDYTDAEVEAYIENSGSWVFTDLINQEIAKRKIRIVGVCSRESPVLNNGIPIDTPLKWLNGDAQTLRFWAYNAGGAVLTTGAVLAATGNVFLRTA